MLELVDAGLQKVGQGTVLSREAPELAGNDIVGAALDRRGRRWREGCCGFAAEALAGAGEGEGGSGDGEGDEPLETAQNGTYKPLSRPLFIYAKKESFTRPEVEAFIGYILDHETEIARAAQFVPLTGEQALKARASYEAALKEAQG